MPTGQGHGDCARCGGKCCRYVTIQIDRPTRKVDVDEIRWFLAHHNVEVFIEDRKWYVQVYNRCKHLTEDNRCAIYEERFQVCREHGVDECEESQGRVEATIFRTTEEFDAYWSGEEAKRTNGRARGKKIAKRRGVY